jgi:PIN domain nuclease of toxin-antitoxin system
VTAYLLDTHIALLGLASPERISPKVRRTVENGLVYLSVISYWEVVLKSMKRKLDVGDPRAWWPEALDQLGATPLPLKPEHVSEICSLTPVHADPFDRALIAQAISENLVLVTRDEAIAKYASHRLKVIA